MLDCWAKRGQVRGGEEEEDESAAAMESGCTQGDGDWTLWLRIGVGGAKGLALTRRALRLLVRGKTPQCGQRRGPNQKNQRGKGGHRPALAGWNESGGGGQSAPKGRPLSAC